MKHDKAVLSLPAQALRRLPAAATLVCRAYELAGGARGFWVTTSRAHWAAARAGGYPAANGHEWLALALAAERGACKLAVEQWLTDGGVSCGGSPWLIRGTLYSLTGCTLRASDPAQAWDATPLGVTVGDVLAHFGAELVGLDPPLGEGGRAPRQEGLL